MVSRDLTLQSSSDAPAEGQYWAILYKLNDGKGSYVSNEVDLADYICLSREEVAALRVGGTLEMSRFVPLRMALGYRRGIGTDGYEDVSIRSIDTSTLYDKGNVIYINRNSWDEVVLQDWNGCWRVINDDNEYIPKQVLDAVTLSFSPNIRFYDYYTPYHITKDSLPYYEWDEPYDFFEFNSEEVYFEALITVKNGVITEMTIPRDY